MGDKVRSLRDSGEWRCCECGVCVSTRCCAGDWASEFSESQMATVEASECTECATSDQCFSSSVLAPSCPSGVAGTFGALVGCRDGGIMTRGRKTGAKALSFVVVGEGAGGVACRVGRAGGVVGGEGCANASDVQLLAVCEFKGGAGSIN